MAVRQAKVFLRHIFQGALFKNAWLKVLRRFLESVGLEEKRKQKSEAVIDTANS